jgi:cyclohexa-1,5-dienecarbonyl-CoA hydratase
MAILVDSKTGRVAMEVRGPVARITLQNPPLNVIDIHMMEDLSQTLAEIETRNDISVIVVSGEGANFSAGVNIADHTSDKIEEMLGKFHVVIRAVVSTTKITVASVCGNCLGGGAELAMVCDMVYTADSARWGFPEIKLGCYPPVACAALAALVGQKRAADLILTGRTISGSEAANIGLANRAVPDHELANVVEQTVRQVIQLSSATLAVTKKAFYARDAAHFDKGLARAEEIYLEDLMKTSDAHEGIRAFMEKRNPSWSGK